MPVGKPGADGLRAPEIAAPENPPSASIVRESCGGNHSCANGGTMTVEDFPEWAPGDRYRIALPATPEALVEGGPDFLTRAFRASGVLAADNRVTAITGLDEWRVGGTGEKAMLAVAYERDEPDLAHELFAKFSRSTADRTRDRVRWHMEPEVKLAHLSREPGFPVPVPRCLFADFEHASGTGVIISERIPFGHGAVEPRHLKAMDQCLPDPIGHYRALIAALAHLAGTHKSGRLGPGVERDFPFDLDEAIVSRRNPFDPDGLTMRVDRLVDFIAAYPHLFPPNVGDPAFLLRFRADAPLVAVQQDAIHRAHLGNPDMIALCHWNGNVDNAWFWRGGDGALRCGLLDWGSVGQMHVAQTIWGALSAAEPELVDNHLPELIDLFVTEFARSGGPPLDRAEVEHQLEIHVTTSGLSALLVAPRAILSEVPDPAAVADRFDPIFASHETARVLLKCSLNFLNLWQRRDLGRHLRSGRFNPASAAD